MHQRLRFLLSALLLLPMAALAQTTPLYFSQYPALSPDGQDLYFSYDGDIWKVAAQGGTAERITAMMGNETHPRVSPDGRWLVFTAEQYGNEDLYLLPVNGGDARQLTFHQADDEVSSWSWDSQWIYFTSNRYNTVSTYKVSIKGGTPERIFGHYFNTVHNLCPDPRTGALYFNTSWESYQFATRRGYKGPFNPDIQSYNPHSGVYKKYTDWEGKDFGATIDKKGQVYFVSDEGNGQMNLYTFRKGKKTALTHFDEMVLHPFVSANGSAVVFEMSYQLWAYDPVSGKSHQIPINGYQHNTLSQEQDFDVQGNISAFAVAPDNKKLAFVSKGRLFVSDIKGQFIREMPTLPTERVLEVHWLKDNKTLIYGQTWHGYANWFRQPADGKGKEIQITADSSNSRLLAFNPDRTKAVYLQGRQRVCVLDLQTFHSTIVATDEIWGFQNDAPSFSPDGQYVLYTARRNFETDIMLCRLSDQQTFNLSQTGVSESSPVFSPDGRYLYFISDRTHPSYPYGMQDGHIYRIALQHKDDPFRSDKFDALFESEKNDKTDKIADTATAAKGKKAKKAAEKTPKKHDNDAKHESDQADTLKVKIDFAGLMKRIERVGPAFGQQRALYVLQEEDKQVVLFTSNHQGGSYKLWEWTHQPFEENKTHDIASVPGTSELEVSATGSGQYYTLIRGDIYKLNTEAHRASKIDIAHFDFYKNLKEVFNQMFAEVWANLEENYYNENFNGVNWEAVCQRYATYLPYLRSRTDLRRLLEDMMGELNTSHYGFYSSGQEEQTYYSMLTAETGIRFDPDQPYSVAAVVAESPAAYAGKDIKKGDKLVAVNGQKVDPTVSRAYYFTFASFPEELSLRFSRKGKDVTVKIHPESYGALKNQLYNSWIADNARRVASQGHGRIGYVHMKDMSANALRRFKQAMVSDSVNKAGLILDLRYNTGGNVHDKVLQFLSQRPYLQWKYRQGKMSPQPDFAPAAKPIVLLVNQQTLSDGEMTAAGFKALQLGTVVGTGTYGWIIFTSAKGLVDGSVYRLPSWGCYTLDGSNLEQTGVAPDVFVNNSFKDRLQQKDPQLDKAIDLVLQQLKTMDERP